MPRCPRVNDRALLGLRVFVGGSLILGGLLLVSRALLLGPVPPASEWTRTAAALGSGALAAAVLVGRNGRLPWILVAAILLGSLLANVAWATLDETGNAHLVLSGLAPAVALLAGAGFLLRERWAWPVSFAIVSGIGPLFLTIAPLPPSAVAGAFALFLADALALLPLAESTFTQKAS